MKKIKIYLVYIVFFAGGAACMFGCAGSESGASSADEYHTTEEAIDQTTAIEEEVEETEELATEAKPEAEQKQKLAKEQQELDPSREKELAQQRDSNVTPKIYENPYKLSHRISTFYFFY